MTPVEGGVRLSVRVTPRAARNAVGGLAADASGAQSLKVMVTAAAEGGKANAAVVALLAKTWRLPKSSIRVIVGATDRRKTLQIDGDPDDLARRIAPWIEEKENG